MKTKKNIFYILTGLITAGALSVTTTGTAIAADSPVLASTSTTGQTQELSFDEIISSDEDAKAIYQVLNYYEQIPDSVLEAGDDALGQWQAENPVYRERASVVGCIGAVTWLIGSNVVGAAKILKIKKYIQALGGVKEAVELMWKASFKFEKMKAAGGALAGLGAELLGIMGVKDQCFS